jgi:hypothetical protein
MSPDTLRAVRDVLLLAARAAAYYPHRTEAPGYIARARQLNRALVQQARAARCKTGHPPRRLP